MKYEKTANLPEYRVEEVDTTESTFVESVRYALSRGCLKALGKYLSQWDTPSSREVGSEYWYRSEGKPHGNPTHAGLTRNNYYVLRNPMKWVNFCGQKNEADSRMDR